MMIRLSYPGVSFSQVITTFSTKLTVISRVYEFSAQLSCDEDEYKITRLCNLTFNCSEYVEYYILLCLFLQDLYRTNHINQLMTIKHFLKLVVLILIN